MSGIYSQLLKLIVVHIKNVLGLFSCTSHSSHTCTYYCDTRLSQRCADVVLECQTVMSYTVHYLHIQLLYVVVSVHRTYWSHEQPVHVPIISLFRLYSAAQKSIKDQSPHCTPYRPAHNKRITYTLLLLLFLFVILSLLETSRMFIENDEPKNITLYY